MAQEKLHPGKQLVVGGGYTYRDGERSSIVIREQSEDLL